jgi:hypothetical protein
MKNLIRYRLEIVIHHRHVMHVNVDADKIEIDIPEADEWVERIGKTEMCNNNHIKLKTLENGRRTGFIIESDDSGALGADGQSTSCFF